MTIALLSSFMQVKSIIHLILQNRQICFLYICMCPSCLDFTTELKGSNIQPFSTSTLLLSGFLPDLGVPQNYTVFFHHPLSFLQLCVNLLMQFVLSCFVFYSNSTTFHRTYVLFHIQCVLKCFNTL